VFGRIERYIRLPWVGAPLFSLGRLLPSQDDFWSESPFPFFSLVFGLDCSFVDPSLSTKTQELCLIVPPSSLLFRDECFVVEESLKLFSRSPSFFFGTSDVTNTTKTPPPLPKPPSPDFLLREDSSIPWQSLNLPFPQPPRAPVELASVRARLSLRYCQLFTLDFLLGGVDAPRPSSPSDPEAAFQLRISPPSSSSSPRTLRRASDSRKSLPFPNLVEKKPPRPNTLEKHPSFTLSDSKNPLRSLP